MKREDITYLLKVAIFIALFVVAIRFFIYLLPVIILALIGMLIYDSYKKSGGFKKEKKNNIVEAEIIREKKNN